MDMHGSYPSRLSIACNELLPRIQNQSCTVDTYFLQSSIDRIFNDSQIDLLSVLLHPRISDSVNEYDQVIELIGPNSVIFKASLESNIEIFEYFMTSFCRHLERSSCTLPLKIVQESVYMRLLADYVCFMMPVNEENPVNAPAKKIHSENTMSSYSTPLNLFKEEALRRYALYPSSHSIGTLRTMTQSISPHFLTFICILVRSYCSLSNWPTDYRFIALRFVLKEIHVFSLAKSEELSFSQSKLQLQWNAPFADELFDFFLSLFTRWPPNPSFTNLFDIWVTWIRPWRYCDNDLQRIMSFVHSNRRFYVELSDVFWRRKFSLESKGDIENLASYICILTSSDMVEVYETLEYDLEPNVLTLMNSLKEGAENLCSRVVKDEEKLAKAGWFQRTFVCIEEELLLSERKKALEALERLIMDASRAISDSSCSGSQSVTVSTRAISANESPVSRGMYRLDYSNCWKAMPVIISSLRSGEARCLSRLLCQVSRIISHISFIQHLSKCYGDSTPTGFIARLLLDPEYSNVSVLAHSSNTAVQKPCLNLRYFAYYRNLVPICFFLIMLFFLPVSYCSAALLCMVLCSKFLF